MNLRELRRLAREDLDDLATPYLWSDVFLNAAANRAQDEACRRARLITDSSNDLTVIETSAGEPLYDLDPRIIFVRRVKSSRQSAKLQKISLQSLDEVPGWQDHEGEVTHFCLDYETGKLLTYRKCTATTVATLNLTVVRTALKSMASELDTPEIAPRWHPALRHWMVYEAYMKPDEDTYRPDKAKIALSLFEREFGGPSSAQDERWIAEKHGYDDDEGLF